MMRLSPLSFVAVAWVLVACDLNKQHKTTDYSVPTWEGTNIPLSQSLDTLRTYDVTNLCNAVAGHYYGNAERQGLCVLAALGRPRTEDTDASAVAPATTSEALELANDAGDPAPAADAGMANEATHEAAPDAGCHSAPPPDAHDESQAMPDAGRALSPCEQRVEACQSKAPWPQERLEDYCLTLARVPQACTASVGEVSACLDAYAYEREVAWGAVSCDDPGSRAPAPLAFETIYECKLLEKSCPGFLVSMLAPVLEQ